MPRTAHYIRAIACFCGLMLFGSCGAQRDHGDDEQQKVHERYFLDRLSMKVRHGKLMSDDEVEQYKTEDLDSIIPELMKDRDFIDTVFDFNLYFLGFKNPNLEAPSGKVSEQFKATLDIFSNAIASAQAVASDGDYLTLFDLRQKIYAKPLTVGKFKVGDFSLDYDADRAQGLEIFRKVVRDSKALLRADRNILKDEVCSADLGLKSVSDALGMLHSPVAESDAGSLPLLMTIAEICSPTGEGEEREDDSEPKFATEPVPDAVRKQLLSELLAAEAYVNYILQFMPDNYQINSVLDFKVLDTSPLQAFKNDALRNSSLWFWNHLFNSSTNYNRKRAAYVLKRFMCDDLTPIAVEQPKEHARQGKHASDPGCMACHYKLDPVAGFFREYGGGGFRFEKNPQQTIPSEIFFDDGAKKNYDEYVAEWKGRKRRLEIGIIRSTTDDSQNVYPKGNETGPEDLFAMLRDLPEARQCIVENAVKYLVDEKLTVDTGYIRHLSDRFNERVEENSSQALRELFVDILSSNSFKKEAIEEGVCYDYAPGVNPAQRPPCMIADVIERNCTSCHAGAGARGGLDLREWVSLGDGFGFTHKDNGQQLSRAESFQRISEALSTTDEAKRMPLDAFMAPADREALYKFFNTVK